MVSWIGWNETETPSAAHPWKVSVRNPVSNYVNGGPIQMPNMKVFYNLQCGHVAPGPVHLNVLELPCIWHDETLSRVVGVQTHEWHAKCDNCQFGRWAGISKRNAEIMASKHFQGNAQHVVRVDFVLNPIAVTAGMRLDALLH